MITPHLFITDTNLLEGNAIEQLKSTSLLSGIISSVGFPDLHAGKGSPVGAAYLTSNIIYPYIIGNDIGCGMALFKTDLECHKFKADKIERKLDDLESPYEESRELFKQLNIGENLFPDSLGTLGGGNHFAEFLKIEEIINEEEFLKLNISKKEVFLLVHSGSRGLGQSILEEHIRHHNSEGLDPNSSSGINYLNRHNYALSWAKFNREMIAQRISEKIGISFERLLDLVHNSIEDLSENKFLHRKGAARIDNLGIIPGSRGDFTYLVAPQKNSLETLFSLPHGSGRKWIRGHVKDRLSHKFKAGDLKKTALGSTVICEDKELLYDEAPEAYKKVIFIIDELEKNKLAKPVLKFRPLFTYKKRNTRW